MSLDSLIKDLRDGKPLGTGRRAVNCPACGRFAHVISEGRDWEGEWYCEVRCKNCGLGVVA